MGTFLSSLCASEGAEKNGATDVNADDTKKPATDVTEGVSVEEVCFGAGCYWGTQKYFEVNFAEKFPEVLVKGSGAVGFMGPASAKKNPSYQEVCSGTTGHVEVYKVQFKADADGENFRELVKWFYQFHDPTSPNRQGNDKGTQYASVLYCYNSKQMRIAKDISLLLGEHLSSGKIKFEKNREFQGSTVTTDLRLSTEVCFNIDDSMPLHVLLATPGPPPFTVTVPSLSCTHILSLPTVHTTVILVDTRLAFV